MSRSLRDPAPAFRSGLRNKQREYQRALASMLGAEATDARRLMAQMVREFADAHGDELAKSELYDALEFEDAWEVERLVWQLNKKDAVG